MFVNDFYSLQVHLTVSLVHHLIHIAFCFSLPNLKLATSWQKYIIYVFIYIYFLFIYYLYSLLTVIFPNIELIFTYDVWQQMPASVPLPYVSNPSPFGVTILSSMPLLIPLICRYQFLQYDFTDFTNFFLLNRRRLKHQRI